MVTKLGVAEPWFEPEVVSLQSPLLNHSQARAQLDFMDPPPAPLIEPTVALRACWQL